MRKKRRAFYILFVIIFSLYCVNSGCGRKTEEVYDTSFSEAEAVQDEDSGKEAAEDMDDGEKSTEDQEDDSSEYIQVYVCGQVKSPGVYELEAGDRIAQAICAAGGMTAEAAETWLNQAAVLEDGQMIYVPSKEEAQKSAEESGGFSASMEAPGGSGTQDNSAESKVNLNTAEKALLMTLSGIGESRAEAIIAYREENGGFQSIEEIKEIEGIKEGIFNRIKDQITVE